MPYKYFFLNRRKIYSLHLIPEIEAFTGGDVMVVLKRKKTFCHNFTEINIHGLPSFL